MRFLLITFVFIAFNTSCGVTNENNNKIFRNVEGDLTWGFSPASDGTGMTFTVDDTKYGVPGTFEDYQEFFDDDNFTVKIIADYRLTGQNSVRGWGVTYPEIELILIRSVVSN